MCSCDSAQRFHAWLVPYSTMPPPAVPRNSFLQLELSSPAHKRSCQDGLPDEPPTATAKSKPSVQALWSLLRAFWHTKSNWHSCRRNVPPCTSFQLRDTLVNKCFMPWLRGKISQTRSRSPHGCLQHCCRHGAAQRACYFFPSHYLLS